MKGLSSSFHTPYLPSRYLPAFMHCLGVVSGYALCSWDAPAACCSRIRYVLLFLFLLLAIVFSSLLSSVLCEHGKTT